MFRVAPAENDVANGSLGPQDNTNDGDLNFDKGLVSSRLDLFSEFDLRYKRRYGMRISAATWYDSVYHESNDNPGYLGGALVNTQSVPAGEFAEETQDLHGQYGEILDAFVYGGFNVGKKSINLKAGRFAQLYGESLFFGSNTVAGAMTSLDLARALSVPQSEFKEVARPTGQFAAQLQVNSKLALAAYYQFEWRKSRLPAAGSYFAFADFVDKGGETIILGPGQMSIAVKTLLPTTQVSLVSRPVIKLTITKWVSMPPSSTTKCRSFTCVRGLTCRRAVLAITPRCSPKTSKCMA